MSKMSEAIEKAIVWKKVETQLSEQIEWAETHNYPELAEALIAAREHAKTTSQSFSKIAADEIVL